MLPYPLLSLRVRPRLRPLDLCGPVPLQSSIVDASKSRTRATRRAVSKCRPNANDPSPVVSSQSSPLHARFIGTDPPRKTPLENPTHQAYQPGACYGANGRYVPLPKRGVEGSLYRDTNRAPRIVPSRPQPGPREPRPVVRPCQPAPENGRRDFLWKLGSKPLTL